MSDSVRPHRRQPTRLCRPWDSPGKNTGVGCHFFLQCMKVKVKVKLLSRVRFLATSWTAAHQAPPSMGFSRQEYWSGVPSPSVANHRRNSDETQGKTSRPDRWFIKIRRPTLHTPSSCQQPHPFETLQKKECKTYCLDPYHTPLPNYITSPYLPLSGAHFLRPHCFFMASHSFFLLHNCLRIYVWHWCTESQDFGNKQSRDRGLFNLRVSHSALHTDVSCFPYQSIISINSLFSADL